MHYNKVMAAILVFPLLSTHIYAQKSEDAEPSKLSDYRIVQYISQRGYSPISMTRIDNNGDILLACRSGKTKEQLLEMGIITTESQLRLLEIYGLLSRDDNNFHTAIPILGPGHTRQLRKYSKTVSEKLIPIITPDVVELVSNLERIGRGNNAYSILFAYVFDGMSWSEFESMGLIHPADTDIDHPFWSGEVYAFYPDRSFTSGTNTWSEESYSFTINWSPPANPLLKPFYHELRNINAKELFLPIMKGGIVEDDSIREALTQFGMIDKGRLSIPVIEESEDNTIYMTGKKIAREITGHTLNLISVEKMRNEFRFRDNNQTLVIFYHELIWDLMDALEEHDTVRKPAAFTDSESVTTKDVADLMFIVRTNIE